MTPTPLGVIQYWRDEVGEARWFDDDPALDAQIAHIVRNWRDELRDELCAAHGDELGGQLADAHVAVFAICAHPITRPVSVWFTSTMPTCSPAVCSPTTG